MWIWYKIEGYKGSKFKVDKSKKYIIECNYCGNHLAYLNSIFEIDIEKEIGECCPECSESNFED